MNKWFLAACGAPDGESDNLICALKFVTNLMNGNKLVVVVKCLAGSSNHRPSEDLRLLLQWTVQERWSPWVSWH